MKESRDPKCRGGLPENARLSRPSAHSGQSDNWRRDRPRCDRHRRNQMRRSPSEHRQSRAGDRAPSRPNCSPRRWSSRHPSAKCHGQIHRDVEWCETTSAAFRFERRRLECRREAREESRGCARRRSAGLCIRRLDWSDPQTQSWQAPGQDFHAGRFGRGLQRTQSDCRWWRLARTQSSLLQPECACPCRRPSKRARGPVAFHAFRSRTSTTAYLSRHPTRKSFVSA